MNKRQDSQTQPVSRCASALNASIDMVRATDFESKLREASCELSVEEHRNPDLMNSSEVLYSSIDKYKYARGASTEKDELLDPYCYEALRGHKSQRVNNRVAKAYRPVQQDFNKSLDQKRI